MKFYTNLKFILIFVFIVSVNLFGRGLSFDGYDDFAIIPDSPLLHTKSLLIEGEIVLRSDSSRKSGTNASRQFIIFKQNTLKDFNEGFAVYYNSADSSLWATFSDHNGIQTHISSGDIKVIEGKTFSFRITVSEGYASLDTYSIHTISTKMKGSLDIGNGPVYLGGRYSHPADKGEYEGKFNGEISKLKIFHIDQEKEKSEVLNLDFNSIDGSVIPDKSGNGNNALFFKGIRDNGTKTADMKLEFAILPNPVVNKGIIKFNNLSEGSVTLKILDVTGKIIKEFDFGNLAAGENEISFTTDGIAGGQYLAILECKEQSQKQVFVLSK